MNDNEIIQALESEVHLVEYVNGSYADGVELELLRNALDLIKSQKAEIEKLKSVDVAPVVRCKDCVLHGNCSTEDVFLFSRIKAENAFCCVGKRKAVRSDNDK